MPNTDGIFIVLISTLLALGVGLLIAAMMLGCAKLLIRLDRHSAPPRMDDPDTR